MPNTRKSALERTSNPAAAAPIQRRTLQDGVYLKLRDALMCGEFAPGERLPAGAIAAAYGTSIMPVREAFRRLTSEGALEPLSTGATRVPTVDAGRLRDLTELRLNLEGLAARKAAARVTPAECESLKQLNLIAQQALDAGDTLAEARANEQFHFALYRTAGSPELLRMIEQLWLKVGPYLAWVLKHGKWPARRQGARTLRHHREILAALHRRDGRAAEAALRKDLSQAAAALLEHMRMGAASD